MKIITLQENPGIRSIIDELHTGPWPKFIEEDEIVKKHWRNLYDKYPEYQLLFMDDKDFIGLINMFPIYWDGSLENLPLGFDDAILRIVEAKDEPNNLCAMAIIVKHGYSGKGYSYKILDLAKQLGTKKNYENLIVPVRPTLKKLYPLIDMNEYMYWMKDDKPFDPWIRVHVNAGGCILKEAAISMEAKGTILEWEKWTGLHFGSSGKYIPEGALNPIDVDLKKNIGTYIEPNVWIKHKLK